MFCYFTHTLQGYFSSTTAAVPAKQTLKNIGNLVDKFWLSSSQIKSKFLTQVLKKNFTSAKQSMFNESGSPEMFYDQNMVQTENPTESAKIVIAQT